jgi:Domain of unknown function (DUF3536)/Glycosyl hydrolase family 57
VSRPRLVVHGHFYQPSRLDPATGSVPPDPTAAPSRDWNTRIADDCYRPNAAAGNYSRMSWDLGPTLAGWMERGAPDAYAGFVDGDRGANGMAQAFHHTILPLASLAERRTEIRWGLRDFAHRFGRPATGMWLPETAADLDTFTILAEEGVTHTILAPWQLAGRPDSRRPHRVELPGGRSMIVAAYDAGLSTSVSFEPAATTDADRFARERIHPRFEDWWDHDAPSPFAVIATDGELYGHHQPYRELFLARLVGETDLGYDVVTLETVLREDGRPIPSASLVERTSWSCHHGVARWAGGCDCVPDGSWKAALRAAFDRLASAIDTETERIARNLPGSPDPWAARDAYVDVVIGATTPADFAATWLGTGATPDATTRFLDLLAAQRWRLAMFASCGWFWDVPDRIETAGVIRLARFAAKRIDALAGTALAPRLDDDLAPWPENPSARGLRATG